MSATRPLYRIIGLTRRVHTANRYDFRTGRSREHETILPANRVIAEWISRATADRHITRLRRKYPAASFEIRTAKAKARPV